MRWARPVSWPLILRWRSGGWIVALLLAARLIVSLHELALPGLQQDETLFVNAATLRLPNLNLFHSFHGIPLMIFPYISALKSWLYDPVFAVFGTSPVTIRLPAVLIVCVGLVLVYLATRDLVNLPVALLVTTVLSFDNSAFWLTRDDVGPSAIEFTLKAAVLFCVSRLVRARSLRWVVALLAVLGLGVFNKLNFIWTVNAAVAASLVVAWRLRAALPAHRRLVVAWVLGLAVIYACFGLYYFGEHIAAIGGAVAGGGGSLLSQTWPQFQVGIRGVLSGTWFYGYALAPLAPRDPVVIMVIALFCAGGAVSVLAKRLRNLPVACIALATVLIALQNLLTAQATAGWHYISIYPFVTIVAAYGAYAGALAAARRRSLANVALAGLAIAALTYNGVLMAKYYRALSAEPVNSGWSPAIYRLSSYLEHLHEQVFTADWGIDNALFALHPGREYTELAFQLQTRAQLGAVRQELAQATGPKLVVTHVNGKLVFPAANADLFTAVGKDLTLIRTIRGDRGVPVYQVYSYS